MVLFSLPINRSVGDSETRKNFIRRTASPDNKLVAEELWLQQLLLLSTVLLANLKKKTDTFSI